LIFFILINKKIVLFILRNFFIILNKWKKKKMYKNFLLSNILNAFNNFSFRILISSSLNVYLASEYFFYLFLITLPISFFNITFSEYAAHSYKNQLKYIKYSLIFSSSIFLFYLFISKDYLIEKNILFVNFLAAIIFIFVNVIRFKMLNNSLTFMKLSRFELKTSIIFLILLLLVFFIKDISLYVYFINSVMQLLVIRKYIQFKGEKCCQEI
jgi:hypothetical protein